MIPLYLKYRKDVIPMDGTNYHWCVFKNDNAKSVVLDDHQYKLWINSRCLYVSN